MAGYIGQASIDEHGGIHGGQAGNQSGRELNKSGWYNGGWALLIRAKDPKTAEKKFADGATRKEWVMAMVQTSAEYINYPVDIQALSDLIDNLCNLTKKVNSPETTNEKA